MPVIKVEHLTIRVRTEEDADKFLKALDLIMHLYELPEEKGFYKYSIQEKNQTPPTKVGMG